MKCKIETSNGIMFLKGYDDRIEIMNPGGLYGNARPDNFPNVNDYRNNVVAGILKSFNYVNMFNHGIRDVQALLAENGNSKAEFNVDYITVFLMQKRWRQRT